MSVLSYKETDFRIAENLLRIKSNSYKNYIARNVEMSISQSAITKNYNYSDFGLHKTLHLHCGRYDFCDFQPF